MLNRNQVWVVSVTLMAVCMALMIYQCMFLCAFTTPYDYKISTIVSISVNVMGMIVAFFIFVGTSFDKWMRGKAQNVFLVLSFYECLTLNVTVLMYYIDGNPDFILLNDAVNLCYFAASIIMPLLLWFFVVFQKKRHVSGWYQRLLFFSAVCGAVLLLLNEFFGFIFYIDAGGFYHRTDSVWVSFIFPFIMIAIIIYYGYRKMNSKTEKLTILTFIFFTLLMGTIQVLNSNIQLLYIGVLISMLAVYCNIYVRRGYDLAKKDVELNNERNAALVSQIRPHFLYNVLNTIMGMDDIKTMRWSIVMFGKYLRGNLDILSLEGTVPFTKELDHIKTYLALEKIRYEERLTIKYEISVIDFDIPPLSVQVLVENAIKHGISKREEGGILIIRAYSDEYRNYVEVYDSGVGFDTSKPLSEDRSHLGVNNARSRISSMVDGTLSIDSVVGEGTNAVISIPKKDSTGIMQKAVA